MYVAICFFVVISSYKGIITSSDYPFTYPKNQTMRLILDAPKIFSKINFKSYNLILPANEHCDKGGFLKIYETDKNGFMVLKFSSCPAKYNLPSFYVSGSTALVEFASDLSFIGQKACRGFKISYEASLTGKLILKHHL